MLDTTTQIRGPCLSGSGCSGSTRGTYTILGRLFLISWLMRVCVLCSACMLYYSCTCPYVFLGVCGGVLNMCLCMCVWGGLHFCNCVFLSQCSVDCGMGKRIRSVRCVSNNGNEVNEVECNSRLRPQGSEDCHMGPCVTNWYFSDWTNTVSTDWSTEEILQYILLRPNVFFTLIFVCQF